MIEIVEGKGVGAGKSYYVCTRILAHLRLGGTVCASDTFGLNWSQVCEYALREWDGLELEEDQYRVFAEADVPRLHQVTPMGTPELPVLVVVDECHTKLNARDWADNTKRPFFNWLTQSRHDDNDVIFVSQSAANIDKQIARLVTYVQRCRNLATWKILGFGKWPFKQFLVATLDSDQKTILEKRWLKHDTKVFACYESKVMKGKHTRNGEVVAKRQLKKRPKEQIKRKATMFPKLLLFGAPIVLAVCGWKAYGQFQRAKNPTMPGRPPVPQHQQPAVPLPRPARAPAIQAPGPVIVREEWRAITGGLGVAVRVGAGTMRASEPLRLRTAQGLYVVGELSGHGIVEEIRWPNRGESMAVARCRNGEAVTFVLAEFHVAPQNKALTTNEAPVITKP